MPNTDSTCTPESLGAFCAQLGFPLASSALVSLTTYLNLLVKWNRAMNLVGREDWEDIVATLVADSFFLADFLAGLPLPQAPQCWDLGAGAGLPGLPLRMLWQKGTYTLVEAREKRALFLRAFLAAYPLPGTEVFHGRAEEFMARRPLADLIISRAFMPWKSLLALVDEYTTPQGLCVFLTLESLPPILPQGWTATEEKRYTIASATRFFWALRKM